MIFKNIEDVVTMLNTILKRDPEGISRFFLTSGLVKMTVADTTIEVSASPFEEYATLYPLGLLNGFLAEANADGKIIKRISIKYLPNCHIIQQFEVDNVEGIHPDFKEN